MKFLRKGETNLFIESDLKIFFFFVCLEKREPKSFEKFAEFSEILINLRIWHEILKSVV